jgi:MFS family permease
MRDDNTPATPSAAEPAPPQSSSSEPAPTPSSSPKPAPTPSAAEPAPPQPGTAEARERPRAGREPMGVDFWRLWTSTGMSNLADGIVKVALPLVAVGLTRSPVLIAGLVLMFTLPWLLFALPAGAIADRVDRRALMLIANAVRAALPALLLAAVLLDAATIWLLYVAALVAGIAETFYDTSAQAILPQIVGTQRLERANSLLYAAEMSTLELVGPPLAGFLIMVSAGLAVGSPVALWLGALLMLMLVHGSFRPRHTGSQPRVTLRRDVAEGLRFLVRHTMLRTIMIMTGLFNFASSATMAILVLYAVGPSSALRLSETEYGWLLSAVAAGCLIGTFVAETVGRVVGRAWAIGSSYLFGSLLLAIPAVTSHAVIIGGVFVLGGIAMTIGNVITLSLRQRITPEWLLGRINSGHRLVAYGTKPLGAVAGGLIAQFFSLRAVFVIMGLLALATLLGMRQMTDSAMQAAERSALQQ